MYRFPRVTDPRAPTPHYVGDDISLDAIQVRLSNEELWNKFHENTTEMVITKDGRRMFPWIKTSVTGMDPNAVYHIYLDFVPADPFRYKYSDYTGWIPATPEECRYMKYSYKHPDSPAYGSHWMAKDVTFDKLKLTNTMVPPEQQVLLASMHKYLPTIIIIKDYTHDYYSTKIISFPETQFIAVTAYQNSKTTLLKINNNRYAKGFRNKSTSKSPDKLYQSEEAGDEISDKASETKQPSSTTNDSASTSIENRLALVSFEHNSPSTFYYTQFRVPSMQQPSPSANHSVRTENNSPKDFTDFSINNILKN